MESTKPMPAESVADTEVDWKTQIPAAYRRMVVNKLSDWIMQGISAGPRDVSKVESMAIKFEEKVFSTATSKDDYRRKICWKLQQQVTPRPQPSMPMSSPPGPAHSVGSSKHQVSQPQFHGPGQPLEMQPELQKHPLSVVKHPLPHHRPVIHDQGTKQNQQEVTLQQHQILNATNRQLNVQHKVPDLLTQHKLYGLNNQVGRQVDASTFIEQPSNICLQRDQGNIQMIPKIELQPQVQQAQPPLLQTLGLQPGKQQPNIQTMSQMHVQPQENSIQVMAEGTSQTIHPAGNDWKDELYNKITNLKHSFLPALMAKHGELVHALKKMNPIPQYERLADYERLQRHLLMHKKVYSFLNFPRDRMCEEIRRCLPHCEKIIYLLLQDRIGGNISLPQQKQLPTSDAQCLQQPVQLQSHTKQQMVTAQVEGRQLHQCQMSQHLSHHKDERGLQYHQQPVNLMSHHSSQFNQAINLNPMKGMGAETGNFLQNKRVSTPDMNILEKSSGNKGHSSSSIFSIDPSTSSVQSLINVNQCTVHNANNEISPSGLVAENAKISGQQSHISGTDLSKSSLPDEPIQRLIKAARSMSPYAFKASVSGMESALRMVDRTAGQVISNGSKFAVADLAGVTTCRYGLERDVLSQETQINSYETTIPVSFFESGMINEGLNHLTDSGAFHLESAIAAKEKKQKIEARSMSHTTSGACDSDSESVLRMLDNTAGQIAGNRPEFAAEDLASFSTFCYGINKEVTTQTTQRNLYATATPVCFPESWMKIDGLNHQADHKASDLEPSIATHDKKPRIEVNCNLLEEIRKINLKLIETVVEICQEDVSETSVPITEGDEGTIVRCSYTPVAISADMKSALSSFLVSPITPLKLLVPINYPAYSPEILDKLPSVNSMDCEDLSEKAKSKLKLGLEVLHRPMSLTDIVKTWDNCARAAITEFAQKFGGGNFSSTYGTWKSYPSFT